MTLIGYPGQYFPTNTFPTYSPNNTTIINPTTIITNTTIVKQSLVEAFKPKKAGTKTCHIAIILDYSGSMQSCRDATIEGFNGFLDAQIADMKKTDIPTFLSLYKFNGSSVSKMIDRKSVLEVEKLNHTTYNPSGGTNLNDAIGGVMIEINNQLSVHKKKDRDSIIVCIITDGEENSSRTFRQDDIKQFVNKAEAVNWGFMFLGANIDAFQAGSSYGFGLNNTMQYDTNNISASMSGATRMASSMKTAYASGDETVNLYNSVGFTDQERSASIAKDTK